MAASTSFRISLLALLVLVLMTVPARWSVGQPKLEVRFGLLTVGSDGQAQFVETTRVPNVVGQVYGWIANIAPTGDPLEWSEEIRLPESPVIWPGGIAVSEDRTAAQTRGRVAPGVGEFSNFWVVTAGDPNGTYSVIVKVFDGVVADFTFDVVPSR